MNRNNSFDLIRHIAALSVLFSHQFALSGLPEPMIGLENLGTVAVVIFFSISGFLITASWERSPTFSVYLSKRCYRIFPALIVCSFLMIYFLVPVFTENGLSFVLSKDSVIAFILYSCLQIKYAFVNNFSADYIYQNLLNGSLWTLKFEFLDYMIIAAVLFNKKNTLTKSIVILAIAIALYKMSGTIFPRDYYLYKTVMMLIPFAAGSVIYTSGLTKHKNWVLSLPISIAIIAASIFFHENASFLVGVSLLTIFIGTSIKDKVINGKFDISYGIYIYAFPIQQVMINESGLGFYTSMLASLSLTILMAILSWNLIEKRFIYRKKANNISISTQSVK
ncbi:TPA: acyltransferase [Escherichia coli]|nr:acyltransferase [Escherichia coli]HBC9049675.1 acyltransferase [Escherichia coli]HBC9052216.1 acyltransferase [Escherichia coli]